MSLEWSQMMQPPWSEKFASKDNEAKAFVSQWVRMVWRKRCLQSRLETWYPPVTDLLICDTKQEGDISSTNKATKVEMTKPLMDKGLLWQTPLSAGMVGQSKHWLLEPRPTGPPHPVDQEKVFSLITKPSSQDTQDDMATMTISGRKRSIKNKPVEKSKD